MDCREIKELSSDYLDGRLGRAQVASFEEHLRECPNCKQEMEALHTTISLIGSLGEVETSPDFLSQVQRKIDKQAKSWPIWAWLFEPIRIKVPLELTALILLSIGVLHLSYRSPELSREPGVVAPPEPFEVARQKPGKESSAEGGRQTTRDARPAAKSDPQPSMPKSSELSKEPSQGEVADFSRKDKAEEKSLDAQGKSQEGEQTAKKQIMTPPAEASKEARDEIAAARLSEVHEISTDDVDLLEAKIKALLEKTGGKLLTQEAPSGSELLLTVELPQHRQAEFLAALKEAGSESKLSAFEKGAPSGNKNRAQQKRSQFSGSAAGAAPVETSSLRTDEPTVRLQLRILPKQ
jgi:Putative zinc-finger